ncbi:hypothetical protein P3X46_020546 [Hevea brasiliensis]|uniref:DUF4283 domain-containing protein n=1 Tax=Hevea brasiliensis TaxID=3981 RepID=A0ABQ9LP25_HEVBR|nr:hypothetical protein P3X46_020546 [Hevea brasiliensis]
MKLRQILEIAIFDNLQDELAKQWKRAMVVRLLGCRIGYKALCNRLNALWNPTGAKIWELGNDYFLIKFTNETDFHRALLDGPWLMQGSYLLVQPWHLGFDIQDISFCIAMIWMRFPGLPIHPYQKQVLSVIGSVSGHVVKIDYNTSDLMRGNFARLAVSMDLSEPFASQLLINGRVQKVEYENILKLCFECGRIGHRKVFCSFKQAPKEGYGGKVSENAQMETKGQEGGFGPWIVVTYRAKRNQVRHDSSQNFRGSRFNHLADDLEVVANLEGGDRVVVPQTIDNVRFSLPKDKGAVVVQLGLLGLKGIFLSSKPRDRRLGLT